MESKQVTNSLYDGSKEWISIPACFCADGTALPPGLVFEALHGNIRDTWVEGIIEESRSLLPHHQLGGAMMTLGWHDSLKSLTGIQRCCRQKGRPFCCCSLKVYIECNKRRKQEGVGGSSFWMAMDLILLLLSLPSVTRTGSL
jgi:hypothetical protein